MSEEIAAILRKWWAVVVLVVAVIATWNALQHVRAEFS